MEEILKKLNSIEQEIRNLKATVDEASLAARKNFEILDEKLLVKIEEVKDEIISKISEKKN